MQTAAKTNRFVTGCSSNVGLADSEIVVSRGGLLQHTVASHLAWTVHSQELFVKLINELIRLAEQALVMRDLHALEEVAGILMNLPREAAQQVGLYYHAFAINRTQRDEAERLLEAVADNGPITYRARAIQTLGGMHHLAGRLDEALRFQLEALRVASDRKANGSQTTLLAHGEIAIVRSLDGDHNGALADLEKLRPLFYHVAKHNPFYFYVFNNELAVELGEVGRIEEAKAACKIALASPIASAYPEWAETRRELEAKRTSATPSVVAVNRTSEVIPAPRIQPQPCRRPNRLVAFCWRGIKRTSIQTALTPIAGLRAIANPQTSPSIVEQLGRCIRSRAPPA